MLTSAGFLDREFGTGFVKAHLEQKINVGLTHGDGGVILPDVVVGLSFAGQGVIED